MSIWIRSQDKMSLMNATTFRMYYSENSGWRIYCDQKVLCEEYTNLGTYSTKEKALKVLDEIMSWIDGLEYARNTKSYRSTFVYQMPQDSEVKENDKE